MSYVSPNFKTKKALKDAVKDKKRIVCCIPSGPMDRVPTDGYAYVEGPHYPEPHKWYGKVKIENSRVIGVK